MSGIIWGEYYEYCEKVNVTDGGTAQQVPRRADWKKRPGDVAYMESLLTGS